MHAVDGLSLRVATGHIVGLVGPNGAGKTTTFNACSGLLRPSNGRILLDGKDVSRRGPAFRARRGIGRTFQKIELFESLGVRDNVMIGAEAALAGNNPLSHVVGRRRSLRHVEARADEALARCEIEDIAGVPVNELSTGQRRLVELARVLAGDFHILLLDEPSSGLDRSETMRFGQVLENVVTDLGVGVLMVEHDMSLVFAVCEEVYVLDFGRLLLHASADEVASSPIVQAAYLGETSARLPRRRDGVGSMTRAPDLAPARPMHDVIRRFLRHAQQREGGQQ